MPDWNAVFYHYPTLETERCLLRQPTDNDAAAMLRIFGDPAVTRYLGRRPITDVAVARRNIERYLTEWRNHTGFRWLVEHRDAGVIGTCGYFDLKPDDCRAELGYALTPAWWGKGYATEVTTAALNYAFDHTPMHSVAAQIDPENEGSRRLLEKLGFVQEGYFREDFYHPVKQQFTDTAVFSLLKPVWQETKRGVM